MANIKNLKHIIASMFLQVVKVLNEHNNDVDGLDCEIALKTSGVKRKASFAFQVFF